MINYELAKQLKDAGFKDERFWLSDRNPEEPLPIPTLSELIEACGEGFDVLSRDTSEGKDKVVWLCNNYYDPELIMSDYAWIEGSTPEEAVARLWLELNAKTITRK